MKKYYYLIFIIYMIVLLGFTGCKNENEVETPNIFVSLSHSTTDDISGKIVTNDEKETMDIILVPDESYETTFEFRDMPTGHYEATFWAEWNDDRKSSMTIQFDVEK